MYPAMSTFFRRDSTAIQSATAGILGQIADRRRSSRDSAGFCASGVAGGTGDSRSGAPDRAKAADCLYGRLSLSSSRAAPSPKADPGAEAPEQEVAQLLDQVPDLDGVHHAGRRES